MLQIIILWVIRDYVIKMYTNQVGVQDQMRLAWNIFLCFVFVDTMQGVGSSAIRAAGKQKVGALVTSIGYWAIGIPLTCGMVFSDRIAMGIRGIWIGPTASCLIITVAYQIIFSQIEWHQLIEAE